MTYLRFPNWNLPENNMFTAVAPATHGANRFASSLKADVKFFRHDTCVGWSTSHTMYS